MDVTVQRIRTTWSKRSRGFPQAALRNSAPTAFPLPDLPDGPLPLLHEVVMREENDFVPEVRSVHDLPPRHELNLRLMRDVLRVQLPASFGAPVRNHRPVVMLQHGEWVRWQTNNRFSSMTGMADWHYVLRTVSIGFGPMTRDAFLGEPDYRVDERAALR
ncbi:hypothetical protein V1634_30150 [Plantactinospora veratri]|uniref:Uncharacterized protein n=1 Tax=Plantactinospora veratri TaxID=1436122 RepID=A0ABU7SMB9_9ACTN